MTAARATLLLALALLAAAITFATIPLYVAGGGLVLACAGARLWVRLAARGAALHQRPGPASVVEGERYPVEVVARAGRVPIPGGAVEHPLADAPAPLGRGGGEVIRLEIRFPRRGWHRVAPASLRITDPLGLTSDEADAPEARRLLVLPRVEPVRLPEGLVEGADESPRIGEGAPRAEGLGKRTAASEIDGLRSYRPGTPASRIHWPVLARTGELVERRLVGGIDASPVVALDAERAEDPDALDRAVRATASLCRHLAAGRGCLLLLPGERVAHRIDAGLRQWPRAHARLALVRAGSRPPDHRLVSRDVPVFWVIADREVPAAALRPSSADWHLVTPSPLPGREPLFTVAGCSGYALGAIRPHAAVGRRAA